MTERLRFLIDESGLRDAAMNGVVALGEAFERLVDLIQTVRAPALPGPNRAWDEEHGIGKWSDIWSEMLGSYPLYDWLFQVDLGIDPVVAKALSDALARTPDWDTTLNASPSTSVSINGRSFAANSIAVALRETSAGRAIACVTPLVWGACCMQVTSGGATGPVHFVGSSRDMLDFFRALAELEDHDEDRYFSIAEFAFPRLDFVRSKTLFRKFDEDYATIRPKVSFHLAVLDDHGQAVLTASASASDKEAQLRALGVEASGESANTKANKAAMRQREVQIGDRVVLCEWHTKLRPHIDRIYFNATAQSKVVVGIFAAHLD